MKELGEYLKDTRLQNGVSIEEAAEDNFLSAAQLENIENGNVKAFKDVYKLKEYVKNYAKYLGLDPNKVVEEFNDFLFEHTSKISLDDILEAQKKLEQEEEVKKIKSPYTKEYKNKVNLKPIILTICISTLIILLVYVLLSMLSKEEPESNVLSSKYKEGIYESTYKTNRS